MARTICKLERNLSRSRGRVNMTAPATRTRQDFINSGEALKSPGVEQSLSRDSPRNSDVDFKSGASKSSHRLNECCYSISNLILIIASIVGLVVLGAFIQDDPLYEYGEHLLSLAFYRQLIFIMVALPLVLLIPIANAAQSFLAAGKTAATPGSQALETVQRVKLFYHLLMFILIFLALVFVAPYIRSSNLAAQIELELRKHMRFRYENEFSYQFLDAIQEEYQCCDQLWYRANMNDYLPTSCFVPGSNLSLTYDQTCSWVLAQMIGLRCAVLAGCLVLVLIALACLFAVDLLELLATSSQRQKYRIGDSAGASSPRPGSFKLKAAGDSHGRGGADEFGAKRAQNGAEQAGRSNNRLDSCERERDLPLLANSALTGPQADEPPANSEAPILLARANYQVIERDRSQSPVFKRFDRLHDHQDLPSGSSSPTAQKPIKGVLKKTPSSTNLDYLTSDDDQDDDGLGSRQSRGSHETDADSLDEYAQKLRHSNSLISADHNREARLQKGSSLQREQPTRRSLLSVRFAE